MRSRAAQVEIADWRTVLTPSQQRTHRQQLIEGELTMKDVSARQPVALLEILGCDHVLRDNLRAKPWGVTLDGVYGRAHERLTFRWPTRVAEPERRKLNVRGKDVRALRSQPGIE